MADQIGGVPGLAVIACKEKSPGKFPEDSNWRGLADSNRHSGHAGMSPYTFAAFEKIYRFAPAGLYTSPVARPPSSEDMGSVPSLSGIGASCLPCQSLNLRMPFRDRSASMGGTRLKYGLGMVEPGTE